MPGNSEIEVQTQESSESNASTPQSKILRRPRPINTDLSPIDTITDLQRSPDISIFYTPRKLKTPIVVLHDEAKPSKAKLMAELKRV